MGTKGNKGSLPKKDDLLEETQALTEEDIAELLISLDLSAVRETMRKSMLLDILSVLCVIRKRYKEAEIEKYITNALARGVLDPKAKKQIENLIKGI